MDTLIRNFDVSKPGEQRKQDKNKKWGSKRDFFLIFKVNIDPNFLSSEILSSFISELISDIQKLDAIEKIQKK